MKKSNLLLAALFSLSAFGAETESPNRPLTQGEAKERAQRIHDLSYEIAVDLTKPETYQGTLVARFHLKGEPKDLNLDFTDGKVSEIKINGRAVPVTEFNGQFIRLERDHLRWGPTNEVEITFEHPYSHTGRGLHRFVDPEDKKPYLYTDFEPFDAHRFIPCFDQPDLKATYELSVRAPADWKVISNIRERSVRKEGGRSNWEFPPSDRFSTYLLALHAGPYTMWTNSAGKIPLRLFARASMAKYMEPAEWFEVTKQGLAFYGRTFNYPYPFHKYDQIVVPDFNSGAMENVGAVTFSERYIFRSKVTNDDRLGRASVILHEMAHMWFGDLVTMEWWNGLWLNESFATFMAAWAVDQATKFKGSWQDFNGEKEWALWEDQLVTTHPIEGEVKDTEMAGTTFDGITYGKGASVLKQIFYYLGQEKFRAGTRAYFHKYAYQNTRLEDFMGSLAAASGKDLKSWQRSWLQTAGVNSIEPEFTCAEGKIKAFALKQFPDETAKELRPHRTQLGLYYEEKGKLKLGSKIPVEYSEASTEVRAAVGKPCPALVFANQDDYDYVKVRFDERSLAAIHAGLGTVSDAFVRQQIWGAVRRMVVDGTLSAQEYLAIVMAQVKGEKDTKTLESVIGRYGSVMSHLSPDLLEKGRLVYEKFLEEGLRKAPPKSDEQLIWFAAFANGSLSQPALDLLQSWLEGKSSLPGLVIDQDRRWDIIDTLARQGRPGALALIQAELKRDATDNGQKEAISAETMIPEEANKKAWLARITRTDNDGRPYKLAELRRAMHAYYGLGQDHFSRLAVDPYFKTLERAKTDDEGYVHSFAKDMFPSLADAKIVEKATDFLDDHKDFPAYVIKPLKVGRQITEQMIRGQELSRKVGWK